MAIPYIDINLFLLLSRFPNEVLDHIISYIPKCMLPELLYFRSIKPFVEYRVLMNVAIKFSVQRHRRMDAFGYDYIWCDCTGFKITLNNLKIAINRLHIFPHIIHFEYINDLMDLVHSYPDLGRRLLKINGTFNSFDFQNLENLMTLMDQSQIRFDTLALSNFNYSFPLPPIATNLSLFNCLVADYMIQGLRKLNLVIDHPSIQDRIVTFPDSLEELLIDTSVNISVIPSPSLRELSLITFSNNVNFMFQEMSKLEYLWIQIPDFESFNDIGILAPNINTLELSDCYHMNNFGELTQFQHLKHLKIKRCAFPIGLFEEFQFPELEIFTYNGHDRVYLKDAYNPRLPFPRNLKCLSIKSYDLDSIHPYNLELPAGLERLELMYLTFSDGYFHFSDNLRYIRIYTPTLTFHKDFRLPQSAQEFILNADCLTFDRSYFLHKLPENLVRLHLIANKLCVMRPITKKIQWPSMLSSLYLKGFAINSGILKLLNLRQTCLEEITICGGYVPILSEEMFPVSVKELTLQRMGIRSLSSSFKSLKNLQRLSLIRNNLKDISSVRLPLATLKSLDLSYSHVPLLTPFLIAFSSEKYKNAELEVDARGNQEIDINDVLMAMQEYRRLSVCLSMINGTRTQLPMDPTRLEFVYESFDSYHERYENSDNDPDDMDSDGEDDDVERRRMGLH
ncbi:hypothetical protein MG5_06285 [Candida albicans P57072]|nr:hypothetical protein MG5_06285 [Candida albicans P57072]KHC27474.1 putative LPF family protein [Candida albicans P76055]KHC27661.1 putative LPF family protein [Candida albicans P76067]